MTWSIRSTRARAFVRGALSAAALTAAACGPATQDELDGAHEAGVSETEEALCTGASGTGDVLLGAWYGNSGWNMAQVQAMECWQGKRHAVLNSFTNWCEAARANLFGTQLPAIWANGNVPLVTWEPSLCDSASTPADIETQIAQGAFDAYVDAWAGALRAFVAGPDGVLGTSDDRRIYLRLAHEMNGDWYPWSGNPADYVAMWRRVHARFAAQGLDGAHVQWVFAANNLDSGAFSVEQYYPGDAYVDWVAIDGYNFGTTQTWSAWRSPAQVFDPMVGRLRALTTKPLGITEVATTSAGGGKSGKSQWIADLGTYVAARGIRMVVWFNEDKETDWAVFGGSGGDTTYKSGGTRYRAYGSYQTMVGGGQFVSSAPAGSVLFSGL